MIFELNSLIEKRNKINLDVTNFIKYIFWASLCFFALGVYSYLNNNYAIYILSQFIILSLYTYSSIKSYKLRKIDLQIINSLNSAKDEDIDILINKLHTIRKKIDMISKIFLIISLAFLVFAVSFKIIFNINYLTLNKNITLIIFFILIYIETQYTKKLETSINTIIFADSPLA